MDREGFQRKAVPKLKMARNAGDEMKDDCAVNMWCACGSAKVEIGCDEQLQGDSASLTISSKVSLRSEE